MQVVAATSSIISLQRSIMYTVHEYCRGFHCVMVLFLGLICVLFGYDGIVLQAVSMSAVRRNASAHRLSINPLISRHGPYALHCEILRHEGH